MITADSDFAPSADYDYTDFEERDALEAEAEDALRSLLWDLPARPGTRR
ncbi:hypothetical protein AB0H43_03155 [Hamadaea sp. NPDC050747]